MTDDSDFSQCLQWIGVFLKNGIFSRVKIIIFGMREVGGLVAKMGGNLVRLEMKIGGWFAIVAFIASRYVKSHA